MESAASSAAAESLEGRRVARLRPAAALTALGGTFSFVGAVATVAGAHDVVVVAGFDGRLFGAFLLAGGLLLLAAATAILTRRRIGATLAAAGVLVGLSVSLAFLWLQLENGVDGVRLAASAASIAALVACTWRLAPRGRRPALAAALRTPAARVLASAGLVLALAQFWYGIHATGRAAVPRVAVDVEVDRGPERAGLVPLAVTVRATNTSDARAYVVRSQYYLLGFRVEPRPARSPSALARAAFDDVLRGHPVVDDYVVARKRLLETGVWLGEGSWISPQSTSVTRRVFFVARDEYDTVRVGYEVIAGNARLDSPRAAVDASNATTYAIRTRRPVRDPGWVHALTRDRKTIVVVWSIPKRPGTIMARPRIRAEVLVGGRLRRDLAASDHVRYTGFGDVALGR